jgi:hypothetical protein
MTPEASIRLRNLSISAYGHFVGVSPAITTSSVVQAVLDAARGGHMTAARLILDRISPVRRGRPVYLELPPVKTAAEISAAMAALTMAMASGDVTPEEAATAASVFELQRKALETEELELRLQALEEKALDR